MTTGDPLAHLHPWAGVQQVLGRPLEPDVLIADIATFDWRHSFAALANYAVLLANHDFGSPTTAKFTTDLLRANWETVHVLGDPLEDAIRRRIASYFWRNVEHHVAHDEVIYFLQATVLLHGGRSERQPSDRRVLHWMLAANDYLSAWDDRGETSGLEGLVSELARVTRFNRNVDPLREVCRAMALFGERPEQMPEDRWREATEKAFGDFRTQLEEIFLPLLLQATRWTVGAEHVELPVIEPGSWYSQTKLPVERQAAARARVAEMTWSRDEAVAAIAPTVRPNGLPKPPVLFFHRPFVALSESRIVASSPRMVREHLLLGCWDRLRRAFARSEQWTSAFGILVEAWCRRVAKMAAESSAFRPQLLLSKAIGDDSEIEDIVLLDGNRVALFSVKARLMPEGLVKTATKGRDAVVGWYEELLFKQKSPNQRAGAFRRLSEKIEEIRSGRYEPLVRRDAEVFPVVVTFEDLGDNAALGAWLHERCKAVDVLTGSMIAPFTIATVAHFEVLMALAADGVDVFALVGRSDVANGGYVQLQSVLHSVPKEKTRRLPGIATLFDEVIRGTVRRLFDRELEETALRDQPEG